MSIIEEINYFNDPRTQGRREAPVLHVANDDGSFDEIPLPTKWEVCDVCNGDGKHVNPSIDCGGISAEEFAEDPDFAEDYASGLYDVPCNACGGRTTVRVVDEGALTDEQREEYEQQLNEEAQHRAEVAAELRMGA